MQPEILVALLSFAGTLIGSVGGVMTSNKLTGYRIEQLEKKVEKHNNLIERMYQCEDRLNLIDHDLADIREDLNRG